MGPTGKSRVLQIHPTLRCNLRCLHCYSSSSPKERSILDVALLCNAISDAVDEGYNVVSISGGEPLLYPPLPELLKYARSVGMRTTVTTNAMLMTDRRINYLSECIDLLAISLDGIPESHNRMRGSNHAFEKMKSRLSSLRISNFNFGFIFTLTQYNVNELEWVAKFAIEEGAKLLQIHPLEEAGRALIELRGERPDEIENAYAYLIATQIQQSIGDRLLVQIDLLNKNAVIKDPSFVYAVTQPVNNSMPLSEFISPLIIEADGIIVPLQYGFSRYYALGNLAIDSLKNLSRIWCKNRLNDFHKLCKQVYYNVTRPSEPDFFNWYEKVMQLSYTREIPHNEKS